MIKISQSANNSVYYWARCATIVLYSVLLLSCSAPIMVCPGRCRLLCNKAALLSAVMQTLLEARFLEVGAGRGVATSKFRLCNLSNVVLCYLNANRLGLIDWEGYNKN